MRLPNLLLLLLLFVLAKEFVVPAAVMPNPVVSVDVAVEAAFVVPATPRTR